MLISQAVQVRIRSSMLARTQRDTVIGNGKNLRICPESSKSLQNILNSHDGRSFFAENA